MAVLRLTDIDMGDLAQAGGKAASLGELLHANQRIPQGFVITADEHVMSPILAQTTLQLFDDLGLRRVAVRSSGIEEDGADKSWAGQFATLLNVTREGLLDAIAACWDSAQSARASAYGQAASLAILVQQMVDSDTAGVAFSADPVSGNKQYVIIEAVYGLCEPLVSGTATPDHYVVDAVSGAIIESDIAEKPTMLAFRDGHNKEIVVDTDCQHKPALSDSQIQAISSLVGAVERHYGFAVDIEWTFADGKLYLLQARPITTL